MCHLLRANLIFDSFHFQKIRFPGTPSPLSFSSLTNMGHDWYLEETLVARWSEKVRVGTGRGILYPFDYWNNAWAWYEQVLVQLLQYSWFSPIEIHRDLPELPPIKATFTTHTTASWIQRRKCYWIMVKKKKKGGKLAILRVRRGNIYWMINRSLKSLRLSSSGQIEAGYGLETSFLFFYQAKHKYR